MPEACLICLDNPTWAPDARVRRTCSRDGRLIGEPPWSRWRPEFTVRSPRAINPFASASETPHVEIPTDTQEIRSEDHFHSPRPSSRASRHLALTLTACGASNEDGGGEGDGGAQKVEGLSGTYQIGGASSQEEAQKAWVAGFQTANPDVTINYDPVGSGGGRENFASGAFVVAGSDSYLKDEDGENELSDATKNCGADPIEVPNYVSPIAVIHSLDGVDELNLKPETLAAIFAGKITKWNDPKIAEDNPDAELPTRPINAVHRSDESGTTGNFTNYLGRRRERVDRRRGRDLAEGRRW